MIYYIINQVYTFTKTLTINTWSRYYSDYKFKKCPGILVFYFYYFYLILSPPNCIPEKAEPLNNLVIHQ